MHLKQKYPHLQVVLSIGGGASSETFALVTSSAILRNNFAQSARGLVEASGLDGIDSTAPSPSPHLASPSIVANDHVRVRRLSHSCLVTHVQIPNDLVEMFD